LDALLLLLWCLRGLSDLSDLSGLLSVSLAAGLVSLAATAGVVVPALPAAGVSGVTAGGFAATTGAGRLATTIATVAPPMTTKLPKTAITIQTHAGVELCGTGEKGSRAIFANLL
jgi:hypothetical protein